MSVLDNLRDKINSNLGKFDGYLDKITDTQEVLLNVVSQVFDIAIELFKTLTIILENVAELGPVLVLLVPTLCILFVVSKVSQIL